MSRLDTRMLWLLSLCAFASMAVMRVCDPMLPAFASEFSTTTGHAARTISGFALAYGLLQLFYGPLGDRHGKARVIGYATLASTIGCAMAALSPSLDWLVASRVLTGMAAAGIIPLTMAWIGDSVGYEARQEVLAKLLSATVFGMICGQWLGGVIADVFSWRFAFAGLAVIFLVCGTLLTRKAAALEASQAAPDTRSFALRIAGVLRNPWAKTVLFVTCIEGAFAFSALAFIPSHLHSTFNLSMPFAGGVVALYGVGGLVFSYCARYLVRRIGEVGLAGLGGSCLGIALATIAFASSWMWSMPACLVAGFGFYALHNTLQTNATQMAPSARGTAVAMFASILFLGQSIGILLSAWVVDRFLAPTVFIASSLGLLVLGWLFATLIARRQKQHKEV